MMRLLLFTYFISILHYVTCYPTTTGGDLQNNDITLQQLLQENQDRSFLRRAPRHDTFLPSPRYNHNHFSGLVDLYPDSGFNWNGDRNRQPIRSFRQSDFVFDDDNLFNDVVVPNERPTTRRPINNVRPNTQRPIGSSTIAIPGMATTRSACEDSCRATSQFDPVCGDNKVTYTNVYWLRCAQRCGRNVNIKHPGACPRVP